MCKGSCYGMKCTRYVLGGDEEHLATEEEIRDAYGTVVLDANTDLEEGGLPLLSDGRTAVLNTTDQMTILFGATGRKKTRILAGVLAGILALAGESMIIMDVKGEYTSGAMASQIMGILKKKSYNVRILNFRTMDQDGFDFLGALYQEYRSCSRQEAMVKMHQMIGEMSAFYKGSQLNPLWQRNADAYLMGVMSLLFELCDDPEKINLLSLASFTDGESCCFLERTIETLEQKNNVLTMLRSVLAEAENTKRSTLATVSSLFSDFIINEKMLRMLSCATFGLEELYEKKTALFFVMPEETDVYSPVIGQIVSQINRFLVKKAYEFGSSLPRRVNYICDEFCNYYIPGMDKNISTHRSRNIRWYLVCQGISQLKMAYPKEFGTILSNCTNLYFTGSPESELLEELSQRAGYTIDSEEGGMRPLIGVGDLRRLKKEKNDSEVYVTDGERTFITTLPDIDRYIFFEKSKEALCREGRTFPPVPVYNAEQMARDVIAAQQAGRLRKECRRKLTKNEEELADKYAKMFQ